MSNIRDFTLTPHAISRLLERHPHIDIEDGDPATKKKAIYEFMYGATEEKAFQNDIAFITYLSGRYGFDQYTMFVRENVVFVGKTASGEYGNRVIVTVLEKNKHSCRHIQHCAIPVKTKVKSRNNCQLNNGTLIRLKKEKKRIQQKKRGYTDSY